MESQSHYRVVRLLLRLDEVHKVPIIKHTTVSDREEERGRLKQSGKVSEREIERKRKKCNCIHHKYAGFSHLNIYGPYIHQIKTSPLANHTLSMSFLQA